MNREQVISAFFFLLLLYVLYQLFQIFSPFFESIFWAGILAFVFYPLHQRIIVLTGKRPTLSSIVSTLLVLILVLPAAGLVVSTIAIEAIKLYDLASTNLTAEKIGEWITYLKALKPIASLQTHVLESEELQKNLVTYLLNIAKVIGNYSTGLLAGATKNILLILIQIVLVIFLLFFFFLDGEKMLGAIQDVLPMERKNKKAIFNKLSETLAAVVRGQFVTALIQASIASFMFWILGLPIPLFFGFLTFISSMIPVTGAATIWVPLAIYLLASHAYVKALILFLVGTFCISLLDNLLKPYLIGEKTRLPVLLLFFGILGGLKVYGLTGIFLGPVLLALFFALVKIYQQEYLELRK